MRCASPMRRSGRSLPRPVRGEAVQDLECLPIPDRGPASPHRGCSRHTDTRRCAAEEHMPAVATGALREVAPASSFSGSPARACFPGYVRAETNGFHPARRNPGARVAESPITRPASCGGTTGSHRTDLARKTRRRVRWNPRTIDESNAQSKCQKLAEIPEG